MELFTGASGSFKFRDLNAIQNKFVDERIELLA